MEMTIRPELSEKNPYRIEKHRYYELKHFCLQYPIWKKACETLDGFTGSRPIGEEVLEKCSGWSDPTAKYAIARAYYSERMEMIRRIAEQTDPVIGEHVMEGVTKGLPYDVLRARMNIPCSKEVYYEFYRKFFWLLSKERK